jgi:hypothetical protein
MSATEVMRFVRLTVRVCRKERLSIHLAPDAKRFLDRPVGDREQHAPDLAVLVKSFYLERNNSSVMYLGVSNEVRSMQNADWGVNSVSRRSSVNRRP